MDTALIIGLLGVLGYFWFKSASSASATSTSTMTTSTGNYGGAPGSMPSPAQLLTYQVQQQMLANAITQGPPQNLTNYNAFGEIQAPAWAWNNWLDQVIGQQTNYAVAFSSPNQPITLQEFVQTVTSSPSLSGLGGYGGQIIPVGNKFAGKTQIFNALGR
jgi:hypothetical protein